MGKKKKIRNSRNNKINKNPQNQIINEEEETYVSKGYDIYIFLGIFVLGILFLLFYLLGLIMTLIT